jgi:hypothetical protein
MPERRDAAKDLRSVLSPPSTLVDRVADAVEDAVEGARGRATGAVEGVVDLASGAMETAVGTAGTAVGGALGIARAAAGRWDERPGARVRRLRRLSREPLPYLYAVHPGARSAAPRELGIETIDVESIAGTAVGGVTQRGRDFLPLRPFRSQNWTARWQRIRQAIDRLTVLPPIDVVRYGDDYWVLDGHNRVAAALYAGQIGIDANVVELVPPGASPSSRPGHLAAVLTGSRALRTAGAGRPVSAITDDDIDLPETPT